MSRQIAAILIVLMAAPLISADKASIPKPWTQGLFVMRPYRAGADHSILYGTQLSLYIQAGFPQPTQLSPGVWTAKFSVASGVQQFIKAEAYRGRRIRWTAHLRTEGVGDVWKNDSGGATRSAATKRDSPGAGVYAFIDSRDGTLKYVMTRDRLVGTNDWTVVEMVFDVPAESVVITLGFFLAGEGKLWASGFEFEEVGRGTEVTPDLDLTATQRYQHTYAMHKRRLEQYSKSAAAPNLRIGETDR